MKRADSISVAWVALMALLLSCGNKQQKQQAQAPAAVKADVPAPVTAVPELTAETFAATIRNGKYSMIEFGGRHCIPCVQMQPTLLKLYGRYRDAINIANVFANENMGLAREYSIYLIPTQIIFDRQGNPMERHMGFWPEEEILITWKKLGILHE